MPEPRAWSPEDPHLYDCVVTLTPQLPARDGGVGAAPHTVEQEEDAAGDAGHAVPPARVGDAVRTYFGLRAVGSGRWGGKPYEYVLLNGAPVYLRGALDQAFHPDGLHAYPSDAAIRADVQAAKALGLNLLRCHIKVNDPRYYYWCDRLGVLMMYDLPSASVYTPRRAGQLGGHLPRRPGPGLLAPLHLRLGPVQRDLGPGGAPAPRGLGLGQGDVLPGQVARPHAPGGGQLRLPLRPRHH